MSQSDNLTPIIAEPREAGFVVPLIGRKANKDIYSFPGFPLIRAGETINREHVECAQRLGCLFELTDATSLE